MFDLLKNIQDGLISSVELHFKRQIYNNIKKSNSPTGIIGERGIGKTYILLQNAKETPNSFYFSADNSWIMGYGIFKFASDLIIEKGIKAVFIDEIQKYPNWASELKNIIDSFPKTKIVFSGSSSLDIVKGSSELSRRVFLQRLFPLNFSEYMELAHNIKINKIEFNDLINNYNKISFDYSNKVKKSYIKEYMSHGMYPYSINNQYPEFCQKMFFNIEKIISDDLPNYINMQTLTLVKLKKIFYYIANTPPSDNNYLNLSKKIGVNKDTLEEIIFILSKIGIINLIAKNKSIANALRKEFKIFIGNTNIYQAISERPDLGTIRETFIINSLKRIVDYKHEISTNFILPESGDLIFQYQGQNYLFEIGGKNKTKKQLKGNDNSFVISDDIIISEGNKIPLWLFGLL